MVANIYLIFLLSIFYMFSLKAYDHEKLEERYGLQHIPSTSLNLMKEEREMRDSESMKKIENIVYRAIQEYDQEKQNQKHVQEKKIFKKRASLVEIKQTHQDSPDAFSEEMRILLEKQYDDEMLIKKKISVNLKKVDFREAIELISSLSGIKFVIDADVDGVVKNFSFKDVSLAAALNILLNNNIPRLALLKSFGVWRIVRRLVAFEVLKPFALQIRANEIMLESFLIKHARWDDHFKSHLEKLWQGIVGPDEKKLGYYLIFDDYSKKIFFRTRRDLMSDFKRCLTEIDVLVPQVRIDARVVLAEKNFEEAIGFEWSGMYDRRSSLLPNKFDFGGIIGARQTDVGNNVDGATNLGKLFNWSLNFIPTNVTNGFSVKVPFVFGDKNFATQRLNLLLQAAENKNEIKTILKPSMLVKSDEVAEILVGTELPQEVRLSETVEGQPTNISTISYKDVGMKIKVKPVVSSDQKSVFLDIFVENSMIVNAGNNNNLGITGTTQTTFNYTIKTSRSRNRVLLKSGQTTLISGLMINSKEKSKSGIPVLQEIPVLGWLFRGSKQAATDTQLMIFITPTLM